MILGIVVEDDRLPVLAGPYHDNMCLGMFGAGAGRAGPSPDVCVLRIRCHHFAADSALFFGCPPGDPALPTLETSMTSKPSSSKGLEQSTGS